MALYFPLVLSAGAERILLSQLSKGWGYRHVPPRLALRRRLDDFVFLEGLGLNSGLHFAKRVPYQIATAPVHFALVILEMGYLVLFAWACLPSR
jgi:hypothetical protein